MAQRGRAVRGRRAGRRPPVPEEVAQGVHRLEVGSGIGRSNVYFVRSGSSWALVDAGSAGCGEAIERAAASLFGPGISPAAILLTHAHPDHAGSTRHLVEAWGSPVFVHPDELRFVTVDAATFFRAYTPHETSSGRWTPPPLDRMVLFPLVHLMPHRHAATLEASSFRHAVRGLDEGGDVPGLAGWELIPTPGHTPGHVALFRSRDGVLISGDAVVTVDLNSPQGLVRWALGRGRVKLSPPPWYFTWSRSTAARSMAALALRRPALVASGHGPALRFGGAGGGRQGDRSPVSEPQPGNEQWSL